MTKLSVVVITLNEEKNIGRCLDSVKGIADDIVVVDSYSTDNTEKICKSYGARFIQHPFEGHIEQKNWAITQAKYPHILSLDADEMLSDRLRRSIREIKENWKYDGYYFNRLTNYCGKWIRYSSWYPSRKLRLWDSRKGEWGGMNPHDQFLLEKGSRKKQLKGDLLHYSYYSFAQHIDQINKFSEIAANSYFDAGRRASWFNIVLHPAWRMFRDYFLKLGFLDGFYGLVISLNSAHETFLKYSKLKNLHRDAARSARTRICFFNSVKSWGGGERWHHDFSTRLIGAGYDVIACAHPEGVLIGKLKDASVKNYGFKVSNLSLLNPFKVIILRKFFRRRRVNTLIVNLPSDLKVAGIAAKLAGVKNIIYRRANAIPVRNTFLNRYLYGRVITRMIANSEETRRCVLANNPNLIDPSRINVIYPGINLETRSSLGAGPVFSRKDGEIILGNAGRLSEEKGQIYLIQLAEILKEKGLEFRIVIAGSGKLQAWLNKQARHRNVEDKIEFLGFVKDVERFYSDLDIFLLTSLWEGFGYVMVEAMAEKKPVIAFDIRSSAEIVDNGNTGYLVPRGDIEALAERVMELAGDEELRRSQGLKGYQRVQDMFTLENAVSSVREFLAMQDVKPMTD